MRSVDDQIARLLSTIDALEPFPVSLTDARGCIAAEPVYSMRMLPLFDSAGIDGYAVMAGDVANAHSGAPVTLEILDRVMPGRIPTSILRSGYAVRVFTGAHLPENTQSIVNIDDVEELETTIQISKSVEFGANIRFAAEDVQEGDLVIDEGQLIGPTQIALLASVGRGNLTCFPRPRIVVLSIGSDLLEPGTVLSPGKSTDTNGVMLASAVVESGGIAYRVGPIADDPGSIRRVLEEQLVRADLVIAVGGSSSTAYDSLLQVGKEIGEMEYASIAIHPKIAHGFGRIGDENIPIIVLPGNPVTAFLAFEIFVKPVIMKLRGVETFGERSYHSALLSGRIESMPGKRQFVRASFEIDEQGRNRVTPLSNQAVHLIAGLAQTDCLIIIPEAVLEVNDGDVVDILMLSGIDT